MKFTETNLPGVLLIEPRMLRDSRGAFWEAWNERVFAEAGLDRNWVQDNSSVSAKNVVRGVHYQVIRPQAKLVRVTHGAVLDVAVDLRRSSQHFGRSVAVELTAENGNMLYIPEGFGHAYVALAEGTSFAYKVTDFYFPAGDRTIVWNDPDLGIPWPVKAEEALVSEKDRNGALFRAAEVFA
ncbi:MAG TPA: dTDP-4-dehydrorhamnose 3,5-epimerase [Terracidiphilus sp.]|nr:dTDP-4-dehydrorhamnose 3,5-epimerase [Terracidiphilus sp.]